MMSSQGFEFFEKAMVRQGFEDDLEAIRGVTHRITSLSRMKCWQLPHSFPGPR
jgi:hypothetical protein